MGGNRYYWLKLKRDFFKRHDIRIIEGMERGGQMVLFYLKLLCESVDHDGALRFSEDIPYSYEMLASVTDTELEVVKGALKVLESLGMVKIDKDDTIIMCGLESMLGSETDWAQKKRQQKENQGKVGGNSGETQGKVGGNFPSPQGKFSDKSIEKEKEKEKETRVRERKEEEEKRVVPTRALPRFIKPSLEEVKQYCEERGNGIDAQQFYDFYEAKGWKVGNQSMKDWKACVRTWEARNKKEQKAQKGVEYMQNEYSKEHLDRKEQESMDVLDALLKEHGYATKQTKPDDELDRLLMED